MSALHKPKPPGLKDHLAIDRDPPLRHQSRNGSVAAIHPDSRPVP